MIKKGWSLNHTSITVNCKLQFACTCVVVLYVGVQLRAMCFYNNIFLFMLLIVMLDENLEVNNHS